MIVAIDYDMTYTLDPVAWDQVIAALQSSGHNVICVTGRHESEQVDLPIEVYYTAKQAKQPFMQNLGISVDVWIDDNPASVGHTTRRLPIRRRI